MGGLDKGLITWRGKPLGHLAAQALAPQVRRLFINANRHADSYAAWGWPVIADDADLPAAAGPLVGMLTGLRRAAGPWLQLSPCDSPCLPDNLVMRLLEAATSQTLDIAVPWTRQVDGTGHHHWTTALLNRRVLPSLEAAVIGGERRVHGWAATQRWAGVPFDQADAFLNLNSAEALRETP